MKKLTALLLALLLLASAPARVLAEEQPSLPFQEDMMPEEETVPPLPTGEEISPALPPELEEAPLSPSETEENQTYSPDTEEISPLPPVEEPPVLPVWTEVSTIEQLCAAAGAASHIRLTADLTATAPDLQFFPFWTSTTLDMNGHCIQVTRGGCLALGGGAHPLILLGEGGEAGLFQVEDGGQLQLGDIDASQASGLLARQSEGGWLVVVAVVAQPEQIIYAQAPVVRDRFSGFAAVPQGLSQEELLEQLPDAKVFVNYQGQYESAVISSDQLSWELEGHWEDIAAGRRTVLHPQPAGPITGEDWFESGLTPTVLAPLSCELAILVDGAAIGDIYSNHDVYGSGYEMQVILPNRVQPEGLSLSQEREPACLSFSLDGGESWQSVPASGQGLYNDLLYVDIGENRDTEPWETTATISVFQMNLPILVQVWADYQGENYTYRLYTDTLLLSPEGSHIQPGAGGSRGGTVALLPTPPEPVQPPDGGEPTDPPDPGEDTPNPPGPGGEPTDPPDPGGDTPNPPDSGGEPADPPNPGGDTSNPPDSGGELTDPSTPDENTPGVPGLDGGTPDSSKWSDSPVGIPPEHMPVLPPAVPDLPSQHDPSQPELPAASIEPALPPPQAQEECPVLSGQSIRPSTPSPVQDGSAAEEYLAETSDPEVQAPASVQVPEQDPPQTESRPAVQYDPQQPQVAHPPAPTAQPSAGGTLLSYPAFQVAAGTLITGILITAAAAAKPAFLVKWLRRLFSRP